MSAKILAFPTKQHIALRGLDILPVDRRGFVILDGCVPLSLASELMALIEAHAESPVEPVGSGVPAYDRAKLSFDMVQSEMRGLVLIDACLPQQLAQDFLALAELQFAA
jgi:hypothetical protein